MAGQLLSLRLDRMTAGSMATECWCPHGIDAGMRSVCPKRQRAHRVASQNLWLQKRGCCAHNYMASQQHQHFGFRMLQAGLQVELRSIIDAAILATTLMISFAHTHQD